MYAISESTSESEVTNALGRIVPHMYGDHELCSQVKWCTYKDDPASFR